MRIILIAFVVVIVSAGILVYTARVHRTATPSPSRTRGHALPAMITGLLCLITGALYAFGWFAIEAEGRIWGYCAIVAGLLSIHAASLPPTIRALRGLAYIGYSVLILAQLLPIWLWWNLTPLTDSPEGNVGTRLYAIPHVLIVLGALATMVAVFNGHRSFVKNASR